MIQLPAGAGAEVAGLPLARLVELIVPGASAARGRARAPDDRGARRRGRRACSSARRCSRSPRSARRRGRALGLVIGGLALAALRRGPRRLAGLARRARAPHRGRSPSCSRSPRRTGVDALVAGQRRAVLALALGAGVHRAGARRARRAARAASRARAADRSRARRRRARRRLPGGRRRAGVAHAGPPDRGAVRAARRAERRRGAIDLADDRSRDRRPSRRRGPQLADRRVAAGAGCSGPWFLRRPAGALEDAIATFAGSSAWRWGIAAARSDDPRAPAGPRSNLARRVARGRRAARSLRHRARDPAVDARSVRASSPRSVGAAAGRSSSCRSRRPRR